jgi:hypothetical protein
MDVVARAVGVDLAVADRGAVCEHLADVSRVQSWVEARRVGALRRLEELREPFGATPSRTSRERGTARERMR